MAYTEWILLIMVLAAAAGAWLRGKLTLAASMAGLVVAAGVYRGAGTTGLVLLAVFFGSGLAATAWKSADKVQQGLAETVSGRRNAAQVLANGGLAAALGLTSLRFPIPQVPVLIAACLATACSDSLSSELGNVYGRKFLDLRRLQTGQKGENGVISLEGSLAGLAGSLLIAGLYCFFEGGLFAFFVISLSGLAGNLADSVLGAFFEREGYLGNNSVNFLGTLAGAATAALLLPLVN